MPEPATTGGALGAALAGATGAQAMGRARDDLARLPARYRQLHPAAAYPVIYSQRMREMRAHALAEIANEAGG